MLHRARYATGELFRETTHIPIPSAVIAQSEAEASRILPPGQINKLILSARRHFAYLYDIPFNEYNEQYSHSRKNSTHNDSFRQPWLYLVLLEASAGEDDQCVVL